MEKVSRLKENLQLYFYILFWFYYSFLFKIVVLSFDLHTIYIVSFPCCCLQIIINMAKIKKIVFG